MAEPRSSLLRPHLVSRHLLIPLPAQLYLKTEFTPSVATSKRAWPCLPISCYASLSGRRAWPRFEKQLLLECRSRCVTLNLTEDQRALRVRTLKTI